MPPSVSIIIVNYNSWQVLTQLLISLTEQTLAADLIRDLNVIIVDNNSSQAKPDFSSLNQQLDQQNITVQWLNNTENVGFASGCNMGAAKAKTDLLLFCNPDIEIPKQGLNNLMQVYSQRRVDLLTPSQINAQGKPQRVCGRFPSLYRYIPIMGGVFKQSKTTKYENNVSYCDWISGAVILMKNQDFKRLNGWDEDFFMFMEDVDLCRRASLLGLKVAVTDSTQWLHHHGVSGQYQISDRVRSKSAALAAKHIYINKHFIGWKKYLAQVFVGLKYVPELLLGWLLSWPIPKPVFVSRRLIFQRYLKNIKHGFKKSD
ncbi:glycosyltransferase family 2 protein [Marinicella gelatinilytica]|uniref:glycosyltransferase family 2 protein n=1 Tax=Marinicella gelatinilytica TaxID=2996017 RepID=UPI002260FA77|nr:glycosyltransferase family 2 protein [Marinicella gelatinilytica]MCX7543826.1 glycosyltransferase family 2 protein [Marinicella gelatinilytica]